MSAVIQCKTCKYSDWNAPNDKCKECIGFSKWDKKLRDHKFKGPFYIGHRNEDYLNKVKTGT